MDPYFGHVVWEFQRRFMFLGPELCFIDLSSLTSLSYRYNYMKYSLCELYMELLLIEVLNIL